MPEAATIHDSGTLEQGVDALLAEARPAPVPAERCSGAELTGAVDQLLSQAGGPTPEPAAPPIATLDAQLAEAADDLIAGEFAGEEEILNPAPVVGRPGGASAPVVEDAPAASTAPISAPAAPSTPALPPESAGNEAAPAVPAPFERPAPRVVLPPPSVATDAPSSAAPRVGASGAASMALHAIVSPLVSLLDSAATAVSAPLRNRSQHVRDMVGWVAMVNLFLAVCVWVYLLAIRSPVAPDPEPLPSASAKAEAGGHGGAKGGHGEAKGDAHASAKKPPKKEKGKTKADAHASAEH